MNQTIKQVAIILALVVITAGCTTSLDNIIEEDELTTSSEVKGEENEPKTTGEVECEELDEPIISLEVNGGPPYYFYNPDGKKEFLDLFTEKAFLSVKEPKLPADISQRGIMATELKSDNLSDSRHFQGVYAPKRFWSVLTFEKGLTEEQYLDLLSDIKSKNSDVIIAPFFNSQASPSAKAGLSNFFNVKLKKLEDVELLKQMSVKTGTIIMWQADFLPLWFTLSVTEASVCTALDYANFFYESGMFEASTADLMPDALIEPWYSGY